MNSSIYIYCLIDPITYQIRYIGKTNDTKKRLKRHINESKSNTTSHKKAWINSLLKMNKLPILEIIETLDYDTIDGLFWEHFWISQMRTWGFDLTNTMNIKDYIGPKIIPWNKDTKGICLKNDTSFKKGNTIGSNTRFIKGNDIGSNTRYSSGTVPWNKGISNSKINKKVDQYDIFDNYIRSFDSIKEAKNITGASSISDALHNRIKQSGGYVWKFSEIKTNPDI